MHRFYCPLKNLNAKTVALTEPDELHHLKNVLRLKPGTSVILFNGQGDLLSGSIVSVSKKEAVIVRAHFVREDTPRCRRRVTLACAVPKKTKMEWIIEKAVEFGTETIIPMKTQRTEFKLSRTRADAKFKRYQTVMINAAKQSEQSYLPRLSPVRSFLDVLTAADGMTTKLIPCFDKDAVPIHDAVQSIPERGETVICIGPEGDFTADELILARENGFQPVSLGQTVLKVETAALASIAVLQLG